MKKSMNIMLLLLVLTVLSTVILKAGWTGGLANAWAGYSSVQPLSDDPNEPEFASVLIGTLFSSPDEDPNEPELL